MKKIMEEKKRKLIEDLSMIESNSGVLVKRNNPFVNENITFEKMIKKVK